MYVQIPEIWGFDVEITITTDANCVRQWDTILSKRWARHLVML